MIQQEHIISNSLHTQRVHQRDKSEIKGKKSKLSYQVTMLIMSINHSWLSVSSELSISNKNGNHEHEQAKGYQ